MRECTALLAAKLVQSVSMWSDLLESLDGEQLGMRLGTLRSSPIGQQLWCLGGCRESNLASLEADGAFTWRCSYRGTVTEHDELAAYVNGMGTKLVAFLEGHEELSENQVGLVLDLLAHEFQHQGQLIRYLYGNGLHIPASWRQFWALEP